MDAARTAFLTSSRANQWSAHERSGQDFSSSSSSKRATTSSSSTGCCWAVAPLVRTPTPCSASLARCAARRRWRRCPAFAELAAGVERVGRAMQEGVLRWDPALGGAMVAADRRSENAAPRGANVVGRRGSARDARGPRSWRASLRRSRVTPTREPRRARGAVAGSAFLATEAANIAAGLELLTTRAGDADTAANVLRRIRALRGVAGVKEVAPLADVLEAIEDVGARSRVRRAHD